MISPFVILGPAKMPAAIVARLNQEIVQLLNKPESKERLLSAGIEVVGSPPEQLAAMLQAEISRWDKVLKGAKLSAQ
jgi:tripartite-type tricarboxylate transporter receptor subunit TctC